MPATTVWLNLETAYPASLLYCRLRIFYGLRSGHIANRRKKNKHPRMESRWFHGRSVLKNARPIIITDTPASTNIPANNSMPSVKLPVVCLAHPIR